MDLIKEPEGVDFVIQSPPLTDQERIEISEFIRSRKLQAKIKATPTVSKKRIKPDALKIPNT